MICHYAITRMFKRKNDVMEYLQECRAMGILIHAVMNINLENSFSLYAKVELKQSPSSNNPIPRSYTQ